MSLSSILAFGCPGIPGAWVLSLPFDSAQGPIGDTIPPVTTATPAAGTFYQPVTVILSSSEPATIYYTTDGSEPTVLSTVYQGQIAIAVTTTLKFFAVDQAGNHEPTKTRLYTISIQAPGGVDITAVSRVFTLQTNGQIFTVGKQPGERLIGLGVDMRRFLARGEVLTASSSVVSPEGIGSLLRVDGATLFCLVAGGTSGQVCRVTLTGVGSMGSIVEGELKVLVQEV